tara:strand:+ start:2182 stop:2367 length:186 start_codon:yes stop_codon:yes gene_type:complete
MNKITKEVTINGENYSVTYYYDYNYRRYEVTDDSLTSLINKGLLLVQAIRACDDQKPRGLQ